MSGGSEQNISKLTRLIGAEAKKINRFLAVSEAVAHLDLAVADGKLNMERSDTVEVYSHA